jgi:hypothetical protein
MLSEEVGELATAMFRARFVDYQHRDGGGVCQEAIQVAAVAVAFVECLDRRAAVDDQESLIALDWLAKFVIEFIAGPNREPCG